MSPTSPDSSSPAGDPLEIPGPILLEMIQHCRREAPIEACGLLGGRPPRVSAIYPLRNAAASETRYDADPGELIAAVRDMRERGTRILGIYHSHPKWPAVPSATDLRENYYEDVPRIIVSLRAPEAEVRVWRLEPDRFEELPWRVVADG
ncbi:Mov34/MPN/PAD-1 family protein [Tautonia sociabilis]|uniref:M67 family peptidase n=1 Tax=Tautonia sociabilis TaxID=2080755 RepID=A0A432MDQ9_9BACT|nr:M67 family metallopeptidase [Tautonia sociabilis]RUL83075.1 M67 family peptidase [Tautonia sociabilis]